MCYKWYTTELCQAPGTNDIDIKTAVMSSRQQGYSSSGVSKSGTKK